MTVLKIKCEDCGESIKITKNTQGKRKYCESCRVKRMKVTHKKSYLKTRKKLNARLKAKKEICTCCGKHPKMKGNRFLCEYCYRGNSPVYFEEPHKVLYIGGPQA